MPYGLPDINVRAGSDPVRGFIAVLDPSDGQILRANTFGSPQAFVFSPRISLGPTGSKLMSVSLVGMAPFGGLIFGEEVHTNDFDGLVMSLSP